ncbi:MAG: flap endonuclease-1 [Candidatus Aenigmarchaeota archaeon]|nr:flap endonuclease-1 [Candidatus Aenigmarchaeota archaeon]
MGIQLTQLISGKDIELEELFDKRIAIDAFNWIYQFLSIIRQPDGEPLKDSQGRVTSHLSGLYYRTLKLLEAGIKPIYVFDGEPPSFKKATVEERRSAREEAAKEWREALAKKDYETARKAAQRSTTITEEIITDSKQLLEALGIPVVQAESEGEALCSVMVKEGDAFAVATQDYDSLLFGALRLVRNLSITGRRKRGDSFIEVKTEMIVLKDILKELGINQDQLIVLGIIIGTDFNPGGIPGYGPKKALELVKDKKTLHEALKEFAWDFPAAPEEIFEFFRNPRKTHYKIAFKPIDADRVKALLCDEHDFSEERVENAMKKIQSGSGQSSLGRWIR